MKIVAKCINNAGGEFDHLTIGKIYDIVEKGSNSLRVEDDSATQRWYGNAMFELTTKCTCKGDTNA